MTHVAKLHIVIIALSLAFVCSCLRIYQLQSKVDGLQRLVALQDRSFAVLSDAAKDVLGDCHEEGK